MTEVVFSPVETNWEGYYQIPNHSMNGISQYGVVIDLITGKVISTHRSTGYVYVSIHHDDLGKTSPIGVHRLMATAFYGPAPTESSIPNHKDGVKDNNFKTNVEWSTYSGNIDHAYRNGLRTDNRPILAKDLRDGSVQRFHALAECARHFGVTTERIWRNVRDNTGNVYFDHYVFRFEDDDRPWPELTHRDIGKVNNGESKSAVALHIETGVVYVERSISSLAARTGVKMGTIAYAIRTGRQYPVQGYLFKLQSDPTPWAVDGNTTDL